MTSYETRIKRIFAPENTIDLGALKMDVGKFIVYKRDEEIGFYAWNTTSCRDVARRFHVDIAEIIGGGNAVYESGLTKSLTLSFESRQEPPYFGAVPHPIMARFRRKLDQYFKPSQREVILVSQPSPEDEKSLEALLGAGYHLL